MWPLLIRHDRRLDKQRRDECGRGERVDVDSRDARGASERTCEERGHCSLVEGPELAETIISVKVPRPARHTVACPFFCQTQTETLVRPDEIVFDRINAESTGTQKAAWKSDRHGTTIAPDRSCI